MSNKKINYFTPIMTLLGVIIGGIISSYMSYLNQESLLKNQNENFVKEYKINKNNEMKKEVTEYVNYLSELIVNQEKLSQTEKDKIITKMYSNSLKMMMLRDVSIGTNSYDLTLKLKEKSNIEKCSICDSITKKLVSDWIISVKTEMLKNEYQIDNTELKYDVLKKLLTK